MTSNVWAISKSSEETAKKYGRNVSLGIKGMEKKIRELEKEIERMSAKLREVV